jgi:hypothetical protein
MLLKLRPAMSAIDADKLFYEFQALTTEEKQHFWSSLNGEGRYLLAERILAATDANAETAAETANTQPVFEHSDQPPVEKQSQSEPASGGARAFGDDHASRQRGLRPNPVLTPPADVLKWSILERIGIPFIVVSAVACVIGLLFSYIGLLFSYEESLHDSVLRPPSSLASRGGALPSVKSTRIESAMVDDGPAAAAYSFSLRPASPREKPTESQRPPRSTFIPPDQSALKAEVTGGSAMNQPMQPIPPASDTLPATSAAPISVPQSATPAPNDPAVQLDSDEMTRLIKRGKDFLAQGNFASARLLFKRAADAGSAEAALALGSTYNPSVIKQLGAVSITPDIDGALKWYKTAADRGSAEAAGLFANLMRLGKAAMAAKPTDAKPRSETEPVEEKANSRAITEPEVPPSTQPLATPGPVPKKEPTTIGGKAESQATGQPSETSDPVPKKEPTTIGARTEGLASDQLSETSDPVLKKAKVAVAAKMEDAASVEFVDVRRAVNKIGQSFETICGHVKGKKNSGDAIGERPFLYLVKEDEAFIVGGNPDSMAAVVYRAHCISANGPRLDAVAATPAPPHVTPEPKLDAAAATPPALDVTPEPKPDAALKAQLAPKVLRKVGPAAAPARAAAPPKKQRVTAARPTGAAGATTRRTPATPRQRDFGQAGGELPPQ